MEGNTEGAYELLPIDRLIPTPENPRTVRTNSPKFKELVESIKIRGVLVPVLARPHPTRKDHYDLRAGERRFRASKIAGLKTIPTIVREMDDKTAAEITNIENLQREDLTPIEEAKGIANLVAGGWTLDDIAHKLSKSVGWVTRKNALNKLIEPFRKAFAGEDKKLDLRGWTAMHLELVAALPADVQERLYKSTVGNGDYDLRRMYKSTVSELRQIVGRELRVLSGAPWKRDDADLVKAAGACASCSKRSSCQPELFDSLELVSKPEAEDDDEPKKKGGRRPEKERGDTCLDTKCWDGKQKAFLLRREEELKDEYGAELLIVMPDFRDNALVDAGQKKRALNYSQFNKVKKGSEGARPALAINGGEVGHLIYVKRYSSSSSSSGKETGGKKTLAQKKKELDERRRKKAASLVSSDLKKRLENGPDPHDTAIDLDVAIGVLATYGGQSQEPYNASEYRESGKMKTMMRLAGDRTAGVLSLYKSACHRLYRMIQSALGYNVEESEKLAMGVCELMEWPWPEYVAKARDMIKEPKAWSEEAAAAKKKSKPRNGDRAMAGRSGGLARGVPEKTQGQDEPVNTCGTCSQSFVCKNDPGCEACHKYHKYESAEAKAKKSAKAAKTSRKPGKKAKNAK